ncbi:MAG: hypothetical protein LRZ85_05515 [Alphaproteobacteria bacterium]|nr:hypothetical protein [Alphaproteobacteria bacterium]
MPYIGTIIIAAGLILHLALILRRKLALAVLLALISLIPGTNAHAAGLDLDDFRTLPIQHEGRVKPVESFARILLSRLSGTPAPDDKAAHEWLAESLFDPASAAEKPVFKINPALYETLNIKGDGPVLLSYTDLSPRLAGQREKLIAYAAIPPEKQSAAQTALLDLQENFLPTGKSCAPLPRCCRWMLSRRKTSKNGAIKKYTLSYVDFARLRPEIDALVKDVLSRKGDNLKAYTEEEMRTVQLSFALDQIREGAVPNTVFAVIPPLWDGKATPEWQTPWQTLLSGSGSPEGVEILKQWQSMALAWQMDDAKDWDASLSRLNALLLDKPRPGLRPAALHAEMIYQIYQPYHWAMAFLCGCFAFPAAVFL